MNNFIKNSIEYYDSKQNDLLSNLKLLKKHEIIKKDNSSDLRENIFIIKNKENDNIIYESKYEIIGKIDKKNKILTWSWSLPDINKNKTYISRTLLNYGLDLKDKNLIELKTMLTNSKIKFNDDLSLGFLRIIIIFLSKKDFCEVIDDYVYIFYDIKET